MELKRPDVLLLVTEWPLRALLRAQLIEEGYEVLAVDAWPIPDEYRRAGMTPRVVVVDLQALPAPHDALDELLHIVEPDRVVVMTALGTLSHEELRGFGVHVLARPARVAEIVTVIASVLGTGGKANTMPIRYR